ncbi:MAG: ice-binding family protein, partial [Gemmatimonadaceae bacterium]
ARVVAVLAVAGLFTAACDVHGVSNPGTLASLTVTPNPQVLAVNATQQFTALGADFSGASVGITPTWSVVAGGGTISSSGLFTAAALSGTYTNTIKATSGSLSATATVVVTPGPLATIVVTPTPVLMGSGTTQLFIAVGKDAGGNIVQFTPTWSIVAGGGTIDGTGTFTAGGTAGTYANTVQASNAGIKGTATVIVTPGPLASITLTPNPVTLNVGAAQQFTAVGKDVTGNVVPMTPVWSLVAGGGTINGAGLFTAGTTPGTYTNTVKVTSGSISSTATVLVTAGPLATITVTPTPATMAIAGAQQFTAVGKDLGGNVVAISPTWTVVAGGGTLSNAGLFTAGNTTGTYTNTVRASSAGIAGFATVIVTSGPLASITVTPNPVSVQAAGTQQFIAVGKDGSGNVFLITPVWSVVNGGGTIGSSSGLFTAGNTAGTYPNTIQATSGAISGTATVTVTAAPPPPSIVNLGTAAPNGIMAGTAVTCITGGLINADVSISPGNTITGFGPCVITGVQHLADAVALQGQLDLTAAYNTLFGLPCPPANAIVADLGGTTKPAGVYCTASSIGVTGTLTLDGGGDPNATFVFQAGTSLITAGNIVLINGAQAKNVYWQVGTSATLGTASQWKGNILALTSITLVDNANLIGRALARNGAVSLGTNNVITLP